MGKWANDTGLDTLPGYVATAVKIYVCSDQPVNFAGISALALAEVTVTPGTGNGDFVIGDGAVNGRRLQVLQQADIEIDASGEADHIAYATADTLLYVTTCDPQALTDGGTVTIPAHYVAAVSDPT